MDKKNILVIGSGGREHAICWKLKQSPKAGKLYCIPGNAGIAGIAEVHPEIGALDFDKIIGFLKAHKDIYMTVVAPDDPLAAGLVDILESRGFRAFGPKANAAVIEASKVFSKNLMKKYKIPTAAYEVFDNAGKALKYINGAGLKYPQVVKADGLALGKGVIICENKEQAETAVKGVMLDKKFGGAGKEIVVEEFLKGYEVSILAFCDGKTILPMASSQDHKRVFDGDKGLNTGGMGTFSPSVKYDESLSPAIMRDIIKPTMDAMNAEGREFKGVLYFGLMIDGKDVKVLEYNARFGDPETQSILPRMKNDLFDVFEAVIDGKLNTIKLEWDNRAAVCVMLASGGYPENYKKGVPITIGNLDGDIILFHSGTAAKDGGLVTNGGRVLGVTCLADTLQNARDKVYANIKHINFDGMHYRKDICNA